jgi:hypothetical protein
MECYRSIYHFWGARNKRDIALKADAEAAMEKLAAGLKKKQKVVCVTNSFKEEKEKQAVWKNSVCTL